MSATRSLLCEVKSQQLPASASTSRYMKLRISFPWSPKSRSQWRSVEVVGCGLVGAGADASACEAGAALGRASPPSLRAGIVWACVSWMSGGEDSAIDLSSPHGKQVICEGKNGCGSGDGGPG